MLEAVIQSQCVKWFRLHYNQYAHLFYKIDNEGKRSPKRASIALAMGLVAGIPDMCLAVPSGGYHGAYFEFKQQGQWLSPKQQEAMLLLKLQGYYVEVIDSLDSFQDAVFKYFSEA